MSIAEVERRLISATLEDVGGNKKRAADVLGVSLKTLYNRLKAYRMGADRSSPASRDAHPTRGGR